MRASVVAMQPRDTIGTGCIANCLPTPDITRYSGKMCRILPAVQRRQDSGVCVGLDSVLRSVSVLQTSSIPPTDQDKSADFRACFQDQSAKRHLQTGQRFLPLPFETRHLSQAEGGVLFASAHQNGG